jgi:hypothetical protein
MLMTAAALLATIAFGDTRTAVPVPTPLVADTACPIQMPDRMPAVGRKSPLDSLTVSVGGQPVKICYGRPSSRGRTMLGGANVPYGKLWRTGANEPTIFFTPVALTVAGLAVPAGTYSLYTVPGKDEWEIIVNRSISQWGHEQAYTDKVKAEEVGRAKVKSEQTTTPVEMFTIRPDQATGGATALVLEWEKTRVRIPITAR